LARVVAKCLAKQPSQRFQTVRELKADLEKIRPQGATSEPSIAVLPFTNMSGDKDNEYFSDGLTEELINALAHIHGLKVTARTSAFAFRGMEQDIRKIAFTLGVKTILEGSVRRSGNRIRVTAQLISAEDGYHLWSERYDREVADIFAMQDEIAQAIAGALKIRLSAAAPVPRRYVPKLPAYEALLKGRHAFAKFTNESLRRSREYCEQAISLDPQYALPYGDLSHSMLVQTITGVLPAHEGMPKAREGALRAIAIDRGLPEAHAILGAVAALYDYDWTQAEREFHQAMSSEPISSFVRQGYAMYFLIPRGRLDDALQELDLSLREDPLFIPARYAKGTCQMVAGNFADAEATFKSCLELDETFFPAWGGLAAIATFSGAFDKALELSKRAIAIAPVPSYIGAHAGVLARLGNTTESAEWLARLSDPKTYPVPMALALYHLQLGELDQVAEWMVKAIEQRYPLIPNLLRGPVGKALRQTSRWDELVSLVRLPAS
jgi:serine/threonine-protein kinase